jgi:hypothetical protein
LQAVVAEHAVSKFDICFDALTADAVGNADDPSVFDGWVLAEHGFDFVRPDP